MYSFTVRVEIAAAPARVWRALCDPAEVVRWDTGVVEALDAPADYPQPGQHVRWRYANGPFRILHDRPQDVEPERTLRSQITLGPVWFDETYTLEPRDGGCRLSAAMRVRAPMPPLGLLLERLYAGPESRRTVAASLAAIKRHCEGAPMATIDPKALAQERFAEPDSAGIDLIGRCATDPPLIVRGLLDAVRERVGAGGRVCELGFGPGWLIEELRAQMADVSLFALDLSPGQTRRAHKLWGDRVTFVVGDMERLPFRDGLFDVIVTCWTLYFMGDIDLALREIERCLTPHGRLIAAASAPDHELEFVQLVEEATRTALGRGPEEPDIGRRFDLETGAAQVARRFPNIEVRRWPGEMVISELSDVLALWPKWQPAGLSDSETAAARAAWERLVRERLQKDGAIRGRRRDGAFVCDLQPPASSL